MNPELIYFLTGVGVILYILGFCFAAFLGMMAPLNPVKILFFALTWPVSLTYLWIRNHV